ncbi:MAG: hypothetical protein KKF65_03845 [Nanoarchaeota archaeon]|nr:hypothetical protein [Nanoarchaeota archaeon]
MPTVAHVVEKIIEEKPFLQEALSKGIINNAALADSLKPDIERELKKEVKFSAINMAIRRIGEKLEKTFVEKAKFDSQTDITIKSNLVEITVYKMEDIQLKLKKIYEIVDLKKGDFMTITQGLYEVMIIVNEKHEKEITKIFSKQNLKKIINELSSITINLSEESLEDIGLFYTVTRALNWENINLIDIVSTYTEMTYIIKEEDVAKAFNTLSKLIDKNK